MPRKIVVTDYMSLDGVIQDPVGMEGSGLGDWTGPFSRGAKGDEFKLAELAAAGALLFGRFTYQAFAAVWPQLDDPDGFARRMNSLPKYVASKTLQQVDWQNTALLAGDLVPEVRMIKAEAGDGDILIYGSASIVHQLLPHGLIDELRLMVYPTVLGRGTRLFPAGWAGRLNLLGHDRFDDGIMLLRYGLLEQAGQTP